MKELLPPEIKQARKPEYPIHPLILSRWSPRSMTGESIDHNELMSLLEAAHWAPSSYNAQPWRFIYAKRQTEHWDHLFSLLVEFNQKWASKAAVLMLVCSHKVFEHNQKPSVTHSFDTGAAWACLALEGSSRGLVTHGIQGFDYKKAKVVCKIPDDYQVEAMIAIGKREKKDALPKELQQKETPSTRKPLDKIVMEGIFQS